MKESAQLQLLADPESALRAFITENTFPCVGAKSALATGRLNVVVARDIVSAWNDLEIHDAIADWVDRFHADNSGLYSLAVIFAQSSPLSEVAFEHAMWDRLQSLADKDAWRGEEYDPSVGSSPEEPDFSLSFAGEGFFVVGLHPGASRPARRFAHPTLIFNLHAQFERLREEGRYERMRERIMARDVELAGSPNPMLARHGEASSARQYSGRAVSEDWVCPFRDPRA